jgi:uncharacterized protein YecE (DUF72 family)
VPGAKHTFPEAYRDKSRLNYYASLFNSLEVNSTFYKLPMARTLEKWAEDVPDDFQFTIKLSKDITHAKGLMYDPDYLAKFMKTVDALGDKKGCLLIQFPASITIPFMKAVESILQEVRQVDKKQTWRLAVEFRHNSWYRESVYSTLERYHASVVIHDMPKSKTPETEQKEDFVFLRFHGIEGDYRGGYHDEHLAARAEDIKLWLKEGKDVYAYFNNTIGDAFDNAMMLREFVSVK